MKKHKKQFLAAVMIVALGAAVYLNWSLTNTQSVSRTLGESKFVNATVSTEKPTVRTTEKAKKSDAYKGLTKKQRDYFSRAKTDRDKIQDKIIDKASDTLGTENLSEKDKTEAQSQVAQVIKNFTFQDTIESTLKAKGFTNCLCYINENGCTITVPSGDMKKDKSLLIKSTVQSVSNIGFDKITVVTV